MGVKLKRLKGGSKGMKWKHGQSCLSNPAAAKFREKAKLGFFEKIENSNLTKDALAKHTADLQSVAGVSQAASVHSFALSNSQFASAPSVLSVPRSTTTAKISIGYAPPSESVKRVLDLQKEMEDMAIDAEDDLKSQAKTFATQYTTCSIPAFENFFNKLSIQSEHQVLMLSFHATIQDIIKEKNLPENPSSYFVAIIMSLEGMLEDKDKVAAGLALLVRVIKTVPLRVLRAKCDKFGEILNTIISKYQDSDNVQLLSHVLGCLSILLRAQHLARWYKDDELKTWLKNILVFTLHTQPKVRKSGQYNVSAVLKGSQFMVTSPLRCVGDDAVTTTGDTADDGSSDDDGEGNGEEESKSKKRNQQKEEQDSGDEMEADQLVNGVAHDDDLEELDKPLEVHPAADLVADFLIGQLKTSGTLSSSNKTILHMLVFTRQVIMALPKHKLQGVLQRLVSLVSLGTGLVNSSVMQALQALCSCSPPPSVLPLSLTNHLLGVLTKHTPGVSSALIAPPHDPVAVRSWSAVVTAAVLHVLRLDAVQGLERASEWLSVLLKYWRSDNVQVLLAVEESVSNILSAVYDILTTETTAEHESTIRTIMHHLEQGLSYQCQGAWPCIFRLLGQCYSELGLYYAPIMMPSLQNLCQLMANDSLAAGGELEKAIGKAVQGLGVEAVVCSSPFDITGDITKDEKNLWLLPLLRKFVKGSRLLFFKDNFVPLAEKCFNVVAKLESEAAPNVRLVSTYKTVEYQIWAMLPSFACEAVDVEEAQSNKAFAKLVCRLIEHSEASRIDAMAALRNMIAADGSSSGRIARNSSNYLPALFNLFVKAPKTSHNTDKPDTIDPSHRLAALSTIIAYLKIVPPSQCETSMNAILGKYKAETKQHRKRALLHLARCFVPYVNSKLIEELFEIITPLIKTAKDKKEQKAAYRVLEQVLAADTDGTREFVNKELLALSDLLIKSVSKATNSSRAPRLRCAKAVLLAVSENAGAETREEFLQRVVGESVMCCGRSNSTATRRAAFAVLAELPQSLSRILKVNEDTTVRECMRLLSSGLLGRPSLCANTIIAVTAFTYQCKETMPLDILEQNVSNMCLLLASPSREIVQACLSFVKGVVTLYPVAVLGPCVNKIINGIVSLTPDCSRKFRLKTKSILARLMRKFGDDYITKLVPLKHVTLHKRLRNLRKEASRARRARDAEDEEEDQDDDADELFSGKAPSTLDEILAEIDPDLNDEDEDEAPRSSRAEQRRQKSKPTTAWVAEGESDDEVLDLLGPEAASAIMTKKPREKKPASARNRNDDEDENGGFSLDPATGKLLIIEDRKEKRDAHSSDHIAVDDMDDMLRMKDGAQAGKISNKKRSRPDDDDDDDDAPDDLPQPRKPKKPKFDYGAEFRSKKGRGDIMRKGQRQKPFAYVPLSKSSLNRRKQAKYEGQFKSVVKGAKKGVRQGSKLRKSGKKNLTR
ncbi:RRP12-like protein [Hyalella azteca]|uniref:RRP12-like protein n=1 Tax=Hyalella azteca TaxID=294128 RepID=A0A8B7NDM0_HYAAZ|nr:RRP12-like protein [Hyalella azteca]